MSGHIGQTSVYKGEQRNIFITHYLEVSNVFDLFGDYQHVFEYDTSLYNFDELIRRHINETTGVRIVELSQCHKIIPEEFKFIDQHELTPLSRSFYEIGAEFDEAYSNFMEHEVAKLSEHNYLYQKTPTIRAQMPKPIGFNWKPSIHTDIMLGHPPDEINLWVPFTNAFQTNTLMIAPLEESIRIIKELDFDFEDLANKVQHDEAFFNDVKSIMAPVTLEYGQALIFDPRCLHATQINSTDSTRISMDVRFISHKSLENTPLKYVGTGRKKMPFEAGFYYNSKPIIVDK